MSPSHHPLLAHQRLEVQSQLVETCRLQACAPWDVFFLLLDLRSQFGRQVGLHFRTRVEIDRAIRAAEALGAPAAFSVPLQLQRGIEIVDMFVPALHDQIVGRPPQIVPALIVDEHDYPIIAYIRLPDRMAAALYPSQFALETRH